MSSVVHYTACPSCGNRDFKPVITATDHTVSGERYLIIECVSCGLQITQDVPGKDAIAAYYRSEDYISHSNTSKGLISKLYKAVRALTLRQKRKLITKHTGLSEGRILDIGAGTGFFLQEMKKRGWEVKGLEPDPAARKVAEDTCSIRLEEPAELFTLPRQSFHVITLWHVLEHVHDLRDYLGAFQHVLLPGGKLFIAVPNHASFDAGRYGEFWAAYDVPRHLYHFSPKSMESMMKNAGFRLEKIRPMWFDSFYVSFLSSKYRHGSINWPGALWTGFYSNLKAVLDKTKCSSLVYVLVKDR